MVAPARAIPEGPAVVHWPTVPDMLKVGVGVGVATAKQPTILNTWSGAAASIPQVAPLLPQVVQGVAKPPPGFCHAAAELDVTVRSVQPHWPPALKSMLTWTETQ